MRRTLRRAAAAAALVIAAPMMVACGSGSSSSGEGATYKVGAVLPLSGAAQEFGDDYQTGIDIGLDYVNTKLGLKGKFEVKYGDGQGAPDKSVTAAQKLLNVEKVQAMMSAFSAPTKAVAPMTERSNVMLLNGGASSPDLAGLGDHVFNNVPLASQQITPMMKYVADELKLKKIAVVYSDETLGQSLDKELAEAAPAAGLTIVSSQKVSLTASDFSDQVAKLQGTGVEAVYMALSGTGIGVLATQLEKAGIDVQLLGYAGFDSPQNLKVPAMEGTLFTNQRADLKLDNAPTKFFVDEYAKRNPGQQPATLVANYFSDMVILGELAKKVEDDGGKFTGDELLKQMKATKSFDVAGASISFGDDGLVKIPLDILKFVDGKTTLVTSVDVD